MYICRRFCVHPAPRVRDVFLHLILHTTRRVCVSVELHFNNSFSLCTFVPACAPLPQTLPARQRAYGVAPYPAAVCNVPSDSTTGVMPSHEDPDTPHVYPAGVSVVHVCVFVCREREIIRLSLAKGFFDHVAEGLLCCGHMFRPVPCETRTLTDKGTDRACMHIANHPSVLWLFFFFME